MRYTQRSVLNSEESIRYRLGLLPSFGNGVSIIVNPFD
jgi:hypothetical protein